eukprot:TRINITY_DN66381_c6_g1_i2.p1 TRINITY_DN66381_c6_g1~~TRINITY_DN66381_c6_g1_i2.p1  ORF type:complete len:271 (+),score=136.42 TRINITY_DN66381_c6_g1_i2:28-840(+)
MMSSSSLVVLSAGIPGTVINDFLLYLLVAEIVLTVVLVLPCGRCGEDGKQRVVEWLSSQAWLTPVHYFVFFLVVSILFFFAGSVDTAWQARSMLEKPGFNTEHVRMAREAERDTLLAGFCLIVLLLLWRFYVQIKQGNFLRRNNYALTRQLQSVSQHASAQLTENDKLRQQQQQQQQNTAAKPQSSSSPSTANNEGQDTAQLEQLLHRKNQEIVQLKATLTNTQASLSALQQQCANQQAEYNRLFDANAALKKQLQDFDFMWTGQAKKAN